MKCLVIGVIRERKKNREIKNVDRVPMGRAIMNHTMTTLPLKAFYRTALQLSVLTAVIAAVSMAHATTTNLYDAGGGLIPDASSWVKGETGGTSSGTMVGTSYFDLDSSASNSIKVAYLRSTPLSLNTATGYELDFNLQVVAESHISTNRGGFSVIAIGSSNTKSLELSFWNDHVWAYNFNAIDGFTHGPDSALTAGTHNFSLRVTNQTYQLLVDNALGFSGSLQDYSGSGLLPYLIPNVVIFGDDTTEAGSDTHLSILTLSDQVVPEPSTLVLVGLGLLGATCVRRRTR